MRAHPIALFVLWCSAAGCAGADSVVSPTLNPTTTMTKTESWAALVGKVAGANSIHVVAELRAEGKLSPVLLSVSSGGDAAIDFLGNPCRELLTEGLIRTSCHGQFAETVREDGSTIVESEPAADLSAAVAAFVVAPGAAPFTVIERSESTAEEPVYGSIIGEMGVGPSGTVELGVHNGDLTWIRYDGGLDPALDYQVSEVEYLSSAPAGFYSAAGAPSAAQVAKLEALLVDAALGNP